MTREQATALLRDAIDGSAEAGFLLHDALESGDIPDPEWLRQSTLRVNPGAILDTYRLLSFVPHRYERGGWRWKLLGDLLLECTMLQLIKLGYGQYPFGDLRGIPVRATGSGIGPYLPKEGG